MTVPAIGPAKKTTTAPHAPQASELIFPSNILIIWRISRYQCPLELPQRLHNAIHPYPPRLKRRLEQRIIKTRSPQLPHRIFHRLPHLTPVRQRHHRLRLKTHSPSRPKKNSSPTTDSPVTDNSAWSVSRQNPHEMPAHRQMPSPADDSCTGADGGPR